MEEKTKKCECYHERTIREPRYNTITGAITHFVEKTELIAAGRRSVINAIAQETE